MIIDERDNVKDFLEHHGVKGQKWGIRNTGRTVKRRAKKAAAFIGRHKEGIGTVAAGSAFAATVLLDKKLRLNHPTKSISTGASWAQTHKEEFGKAKAFTKALNS